jgi:hypothetical protein
VPHPPYSPDIALSNFWLFGHGKNSLAGRTLDEPEQLLEAITEFLDEIQPSELEVVFSHLVERVRWILENNGDDYHESSNRFNKHLSVCFPERWRHYLMTPLYHHWNVCFVDCFTFKSAHLMLVY